MQTMTGCFKFGKTRNQNKPLCCSIGAASSTSSLNERDYTDIEQYREETTDDETGKAEVMFENQNPDFGRDHYLRSRTNPYENKK